ncbi:hypothetical protein J2X65_005417 [Ancylobacter sp. 3268]|uniref:hypothetical protein n=1 Tax=Ancylobacter sp. 3268 TaxID=2817752 RepID=UPI0028672C0E|nr:hypothetical protein [Ancylobacter sp. 3268]MDR6956023.1 hypothetical protein [Ancylobacter sp. 3268]
MAYNYTKQLKVFWFRTPLEAIRRISAEKLELFNRQPGYDMLGLNPRANGINPCVRAKDFSNQQG